MCDLLSILPNFLLPPQSSNTFLKLEQENITTADVLTLDQLELSRRISVSLLDLRIFTKDVIQALQQDLGQVTSPVAGADASGSGGRAIGVSGYEAWKNQKLISTTDATLDRLLGGGIMTGSVTEVVGER